MFPLRISHDWAAQVQAIRDATTEDTRLIRFDNAFYRICRPGTGTFEIHLLPRHPKQPGVRLELRESDLYVRRIGGESITTYAQTIDTLQPGGLSLDDAVIELPRAVGRRRFELQSLLVLCVAESLRNDHIATTIGQLIRTTTTGLIGMPPRLPLAELLREARAWGQTSEAIWRVLSSAARDVVQRPRLQLTPLQRHYSERVDFARIDPALRGFARTLKVIKRPG